MSVLEGQVGLEPTTFCLRGRRSNQLSYWPTVMRQTYGFSHRAGSRNESADSVCSFPLAASAEDG
jgi:hypothetical protein